MGIIVYKRAILLFRTGQRGGAANSHGMPGLRELGFLRASNRRPSDTSMGGGFGTVTDWHIGPQRLGFPRHRRRRCGREADRVTDTSARLLGHKDAHAMELREPLDTRRDVHRIPDGGVLATAR